MTVKRVSFYNRLAGSLANQGSGANMIGPPNFQQMYKNDPLNALSQSLVSPGVNALPATPLGGIARGLAAGLGGYLKYKSINRMKQRKSKYTADLAKVLNAGVGQQQPLSAMGQAVTAANNPDLTNIQQQIALSRMQQQQDAQAASAQRAQAEQVAQQKAAQDLATYKAEQSFKAGLSPNKTPDGGKVPSSVSEYNFWKNLPPDQQAQYLTMKRANPYLNLGNQMVQPNPVDAGTALGSFQKTVAPKDAPAAVAAREAAKVTAGETAKIAVATPKLKAKATAAFSDLNRQTTIVSDSIDKALSQISGWSTGYGSYLSPLPDTQARELSNTLDTIRANIGFDKLQRIRDSSPTGGALGQISDIEEKLLQAVNGALDPAQPEQLKSNLETIKKLYGEVLVEKRAAFAKDFGSAPGGKPQPANGGDVSQQDQALINKYLGGR